MMLDLSRKRFSTTLLLGPVPARHDSSITMQRGSTVRLLVHLYLLNLRTRDGCCTTVSSACPCLRPQAGSFCPKWAEACVL